jgi:hypothetical protein
MTRTKRDNRKVRRSVTLRGTVMPVLYEQIFVLKGDTSFLLLYVIHSMRYNKSLRGGIQELSKVNMIDMGYFQVL